MLVNREIFKFTTEEIAPQRSEIFKAQGMQPEIEPSLMVLHLYDAAEKLFFELARPIGVMAGISIPRFSRIYPGIGRNEPDSLLEHIIPQAHDLVLFAFTLGGEISQKISQLVEKGDFSAGYMLDSVASFCTDKASKVAEQFLLGKLLRIGQADASSRVLLYSPGYCGWHVTGQGKLFEYLHPEEIGITLNESYLMIPLKSISGVLVAGEKNIHSFKNDFPFCKDCQAIPCRQRIASLQQSIKIQ